jgi:hypothetical protein
LADLSKALTWQLPYAQSGTLAAADVALADAYAPISKRIRYRQSRRRWQAKRLTQS